MKWAGSALLVVIAVAVAIYKMAFPNYTYRYQLNLALEIEGQIYTGSSVIEVSWSCGMKIADSGCGAVLDGQATLVDLGPRGVLIATLHSGVRVGPTSAGYGTDAIFLCANAFGNRSTFGELPALPELSGRRDLSPANFPYLVWLPHPDDPKSARELTPASISPTIDPTAHFVEAFVEITRDPVVIDIDRKLPWFPALLREQRGKLIVSKPHQFQLIYDMFVGEA
jgi:hypothetical protein